MSPADLRAAFPVLGRLAYLNAGTCGPVPRAAVEAARSELESAAENGRWTPHFERARDLQARHRAAYAARIGARVEDVALTTSTSDGIARVLAGLGLGRGDEIVTSDEEHPGLYGPLAAARELLDVRVRAVPLADVADAIGPDTALVACSHVGWVSGAVAPAQLAEVDNVPVLLDGAQGAGATAVDVAALRCSFYAASGQKWLCGPIGTGLLYVAPDWRERLPPIGPGYVNLRDPAAGLDAVPLADARAHDASALPAEASAFALAADEVLGAFGWGALHARARDLAAQLADALRERGLTVAPRGDTTLVAWEADDAPALRDRLAAAGVVVRDLPGTR
ncbi:MAG TPA: aminotransferase class V-fold PLP-dependent enzyme, partial [Solirubrobacteraceae bacterium]